MLPDVPQMVILFLAWISSVLASVGALYIGYRRMMRTGTQHKTDTSTIELAGAAVAHWKTLHDEAWAQVKAERKQRSEAENRLAQALAEIEKLRSDVAALRREIADLTAMTKGNPNGSHS